MNKKWWLIGSLIVVGAGVGAYFLFRKPKGENEEGLVLDEVKGGGTDETNKDGTNSAGEKSPDTNVNESQVSSNSYNSRPRETYPDTPFKDKTEGNKFRNWVNDKYPDYAKTLLGDGLDRDGGFNNTHIRKAYQKYGTEYEKALTEQEKKEAGIVTIEMTKSFQDAQKKWNKATSINKIGIPYFKLNFRPLYKADNCHNVSVPKTYYAGSTNSYEKKGDCKGSVYIFNNAKDKSPKEGKVFWQIYWGNTKVANGYATPDLRTIETTWNKQSSRETMGFVNKITVGNSFGQIIGWDGTNCNMRLAWC